MADTYAGTAAGQLLEKKAYHDGEANGELKWASIPVDWDVSDDVPTWDELDVHVQLLDGHPTGTRCPKKDDFEAWRKLASSILNFSGTLDSSSCPGPTVTIDLSWDNNGISDTKTLERWNGSSWTTLSSTIGTAATTYRDTGATEGAVDYRIKFNSETEWAETTVFAQCPL